MLTLIERGRNYDARLETGYRNHDTNCDLFLVLRIFLQAVNPPNTSATVAPQRQPVQEARYADWDGQRRRIQWWRDDEWLAWKRRYEREVQAFWSGRFWLTTPNSYHEVGHLLGLEHSAQHTPECQQTGSIGSLVCYGVTQPQQQDVMGRGNQRNLWHARPWCEAIGRLTGTNSGEWRASMSRVAPRRLGDLSHGRATMSRPAVVLRR